MATDIRMEKARQAQRLRKQGYRLREIADIMGHSVSYVHALAGFDPDGTKKIEYRWANAEICPQCGTNLTVADRCIECHYANPIRRLEDEEMLDALRELGDKLGYRPRFEDTPHARAYQDHFGSFSNALILAGFKVERSLRARVHDCLVEADEPITRAKISKTLRLDPDAVSLPLTSLKRTGHAKCIVRGTNRYKPGLWIATDKPLDAKISRQSLSSLSV